MPRRAAAHHLRSDMLGPLGGGDPPGSSGAVDLPEPELSQLKGIARAVSEVSPFQRDRLGQQLAARPEYIGRLLELFKVRACGGVVRGCVWAGRGWNFCCRIDLSAI